MIGRSLGRSVDRSLGGAAGPPDQKSKPPLKLQLGGQEIIIKQGGSDYESEGGFDCSLIVLIRFMAADVVISAAGAMPGDARQEVQLQK